ncbi:hypothetical protein TWF730_001690 [Orbilia blumenaviensis]|uniref:Uncharacterized protein n=1 Tax=Orbilia blumenaviensis TaxID=1796055 RepID=A0AAV9UJE1_9PEZI
MSLLADTKTVKEGVPEDSEDFDYRSQFITNVQEIQPNGQTETLERKRPRWHWYRTAVLMLIPLCITVWYGVIWIKFLGVESDNAAKYSNMKGSNIYYSWFIIGVFGLSWSQYGLVGVEGAMLQSRFWKPRSLFAFSMHVNTTWSSPLGWLKAIKNREFHRLWCLLALISMLPFVAFPISGLIFELSDGFVPGEGAPFVIGQNWSTYNARLFTPTTPKLAWKIGSTPTIPGFGIVYTPLGVDRTEYSCLERAPNTLPLIENIPEMFLAPQANTPVSGKAWGLRIEYNCSNVRTASEFTILNKRPLSTVTDTSNGRVTLRTPSGDSIKIFNVSEGPTYSNIWSHSELGMSKSTNLTDGISYNTYGISYNESRVFEYSLWQIHFRSSYDVDGHIPFFETALDPIVEGMGGPFFLLENKTLIDNDTFFTIAGDERPVLNVSVTDLRTFLPPIEILKYSQPALHVAAPIGVRCVAISTAGMATLDGVASTFSDFERLDPGRTPGGYEAGIFGDEAQSILSWSNFFDFYKTGHLPSEVPQGSLWRYEGYVHSQALLRSVRLAFSMDALELMYGVTSGFEKSWPNTNLTSSQEGKILSSSSLIQGRGTGYLVLILLCIWSGFSLVLGIFYGFQKTLWGKVDNIVLE